MICSIITQKKAFYVGLLCSAIAGAVVATMFSFITMPISEGWYTEYAWMINHGKLPYRDFEYLFFPLYIFLIAGFTRVFGYSIMAVRILGIFVSSAICVTIYLIFRKIFNEVTAAFVAIVTCFYIQSEVAQVFYDYIRFHDLFAYLTLLLLLCSTECCLKNRTLIGRRIKYMLQITPIIMGFVSIWGIIGGHGYLKRTILFVLLLMFSCIEAIILLCKNKKESEFGSVYALLCGFSVSAECMIKQSNGMLMIAFVIVYYIFLSAVTREKKFVDELKNVVSAIMLSFSLMGVYLLATNSFDSFIDCCFKNALSAKGGLENALFNWLLDAWPTFWQQRLNAIIIVVIFEILYFRYKTEEKNIYTHNIWIVVIGISTIVVAFLPRISSRVAETTVEQYDTLIPYTTYFISAIAFFVLAFSFVINFAKKSKLNDDFIFIPILGFVFTQGYGSGMSGGLAVSQTAMGFGIIIATLFYYSIKTDSKAILSAVVICSLFMTMTFVARKAMQTYNWWGLDQGEVWEHTEKVNIPLLKGIHMRSIDKEVYETVYNDVMSNTTEKDSIYTFPQCPFFYTMTNRHAITYSLVEWFDVSSASAIDLDIGRLYAYPPKMIIYCELPESTYEGHENAFHTMQTGKMNSFLQNQLIKSYGYELLHTVDLGNGYAVSTYLLK